LSGRVSSMRLCCSQAQTETRSGEEIVANAYTGDVSTLVRDL
jgi:hypothetical protein